MAPKDDIPPLLDDFERFLSEAGAQLQDAAGNALGQLADGIKQKFLSFCEQLDQADDTWDQDHSTDAQCARARALQREAKALMERCMLKQYDRPPREKPQPGRRICAIPMPQFREAKDATSTYRRLVNAIGDQKSFAAERTRLLTIADLIGLLVALDEETASCLLADGSIGPQERRQFAEVLAHLRPLALDAYEMNDVAHKDMWFMLAQNAGQAEIP